MDSCKGKGRTINNVVQIPHYDNDLNHNNHSGLTAVKNNKANEYVPPNLSDSNKDNTSSLTGTPQIHRVNNLTNFLSAEDFLDALEMLINSIPINQNLKKSY